MALDLPFATLAQLKARLGWTSNDEDSVLSEFLLAASGAIESEIGRPVRRVHARAEIFTGGRDTLRVRVDPIAKIHHIRESEDRDFDDSTKYNELVEGTDYVFDPGDGRIAGETGVLRRIGARWMGSKNAPGQVKVLYAGGYKTDEEEDLEDKTVIISSSNEISNYGLQTLDDGVTVVLTDEASVVIPVRNRGGGLRQDYAYTIIQTRDLILPTWKITGGSHTVRADVNIGNPDGTAEIIDPSDTDVNIDTLETIFSAASTGESLGALSFVASTFFDLHLTASSTAVLAKSILLGTVAFAYIAEVTVSDEYQIRTINHTTTATRPEMSITHKPSFIDNFKVPYDLRHACLMQASHEHRSRGSLGTIAASMRGVTIASGASIRGTQIDLLPEVIRLCAHYKRMF